MSDAAEKATQLQRVIWALGDYSVIATILEPASETLLDMCGVARGTRVLDVGTGTGNLALGAARRGASVIGSDLTPQLLDIAKQRAEEEEVSVEWREADVQGLGFEDDSFDVVTSVFGAMFAPRAAQAAREMVRVAKPGGVVGFTSWTQDGYQGEVFAHAAKFMPPQPEGVDRAISWGDEQTARERFESTGAEVEIRREFVTWRFPSSEIDMDLMVNNAPPLVAAKQALLPEVFEEMLTGYECIRNSYNKATDGSVEIDSPYLLILARKPVQG